MRGDAWRCGVVRVRARAMMEQFSSRACGLLYRAASSGRSSCIAVELYSFRVLVGRRHVSGAHVRAVPVQNTSWLFL